MLKRMGKQDGHSVGVMPPHERPDADPRTLRRNKLQAHDRSRPEPCLHPKLGSLGADVYRVREIPVTLRINKHGPAELYPTMVPFVRRVR